MLRVAGQGFCNISPLDMKKLMGDQDHIRENLYAYVQGFSADVREPLLPPYPEADISVMYLTASSRDTRRMFSEMAGMPDAAAGFN